MIQTWLNGFKWMQQPYTFLDGVMATQGLTFSLTLPGLGKTLVTGEPGLLREILPHKALVGGKGITVLRAVFGDDSLIMLHGEAHRLRRRLVSPPFRGRGLAQYDDFIVRTTHQQLETLPRSQPFSMYQFVRRITLISMVRTLFGLKPAAEEAHVQQLAEAFLHSFQNPFLLFVKGLRRDWGRFSPWGRAMANRRRLAAYVYEQIKLYRQDKANGWSTARHQSVLNHLIENAGNYGSLTDEEILAEVLALLMFGHESGAATLAWAFAHIYQHPAIKVSLKEGLASYSGSMPEYPLLEACLQESMRLCPVVINLVRVAETKLNIGGYHLQRGDVVLPCSYVAHHNRQLFPEPYQFKPERFIERTYPPYTFFPFGFGPRTCIGKPFSLHQMLFILGEVIKCSDLDLAPGYKPEPQRQLLIITPQNGTQMIVNN